MKTKDSKIIYLINFIIIALLGVTQISAQDTESIVSTKASSQRSNEKSIYAPGYKIKTGGILYSIPTNMKNVVGVTVANNQIIISSGGNSSELSSDNYFHVYDFNGTLVNSYPQGSTTGYGFRDLAFDGTNILGSEDNTIKKIDANTFQLVGSITNSSNNPHRGLAFDGVDNAIWSANGSTGKISKINAATGETISQFPKPNSTYKPYGIALERFFSYQNPNLWFAEPWSYGSFRLSMMDCSDGIIYYTIDLTKDLGNPDSCLSGGLEIIDDHPNYPGKLIALVIEQNTNTVHFVDLSDFDIPDIVSFSDVSSFGGWLNGALVNNNFAFLLQANNVTAFDISNGMEKLSTISVAAEPNGGVINENYLYLHYPWWEDEYKKKIEIVDISNKSDLSLSGSVEITSAMSWGIEKLASCVSSSGKNFLFVFTKENNNFGVDDKILMYDISASPSITYTNELTADINDISADGNYLYVLLADGNLSVYDIKDGFFTYKGNINILNSQKIFCSNNYVYTACNGLQGLRIIDVSNPSSPIEAAAFGNNVYSFYDDLLITNSRAYLKTTTNDLVAVDIAHPLAPVEVSNFNPEEADNFNFSGEYSNELYVSCEGMFFSIDYSTPSLPVVEKSLNEPTIIKSNASIGNKLYTVGNNELLVYDVDENGTVNYNASIEIAKANKVFTDGVYLFVADLDNLLFIYNQSLQLLGTYNAGAPIIDLDAANNLLCLILYNSKTLKIVDYSTPSAPAQISSYDLPYNGKAAEVADDGNILYTASNRTTIFGDLLGYFQSIDISNPSNPVLLADKRISSENTICNLCLENNTLFVGGVDIDGWFPLEAWNVTNPADPVRLGRTMFSIGSPLSDIAYLNGYILVTLPDAGQLVSYRWEPKINEFFKGPSVELPEPNEITLLNNNSGTAFKKSFSRVMEGTAVSSYAVVNNGTYFQQKNVGSKGNKIVRITAEPRQNELNTYDLTMGIEPPLAADRGCSTIPGTGVHNYLQGTNINVYAVPNESEGWFFKEWTGDVSGNQLIVNVRMDKDLTAIANFVEVTLTVSGDPDPQVVCPSDAKLDDQKMLPITLCASEAASWSVTGMTFRASGTGNDAEDISDVYVMMGTTELASGKFSADNGQIAVSFSPPIAVSAGDCKLLELYYNFGFENSETNPYARDTTYTFVVETKNINAVPDEYQPGLISGSADSKKHPYTIARVYNSERIGFPNIQASISSPLTEDGDTCYICEGLYEENILVNKSVAIEALEGRDHTFLLAPKNDENVFTLSKENISITGLTIEGASGAGKAGVFLEETANKAAISLNKIIKNHYGIFTEKYATESGFGENKILDNFIDENTTGIYLDGKVVYQGGADYNATDGKNTIEDNIISKNALHGIYANTNGLNVIKNNAISNNAAHGIFITGNETEKTAVWGKNDIERNTITGNQKGLVIIRNGKNVVSLNSISENNGDGIFVDGEFNQGSGNKFTENELNNNSGNGLYLYNICETGLTDGKMEISKNKINSNELNGILLEKSFYFNVLVDQNEITNNKEAGINTGSIKDARFDKNQIHENKNGLYMKNCNSIEVTGNEFNKNIGPAITSESGNNITYTDNAVRESKWDGIYIKNSRNCRLENLTVFGNEFAGICIDGGSTPIIQNVSSNHNGGDGIKFQNGNKGFLISASEFLENKRNGINVSNWFADISHESVVSTSSFSENSGNGAFIFNSPHILMNYHNKYNSNAENGAWFKSVGYFQFNDNEVTQNGKAGLFLENSSTTYPITDNTIRKNCTGIKEVNSKNFIGCNSIEGNECSTGIHLYGSRSTITNNSIINDTGGDGIACENGSNPIINKNNIFNNAGLGIKNLDPSVNVNAENNWWGDPNGPGGAGTGSGDEVSENITFDGWLSAPISLVSTGGEDTLKMAPGKCDSFFVKYQNFLNPNEVLNITFSEEKNWLNMPSTMSVVLNDSAAVSVSVVVNSPADAAEGELNKVFVNAQSASEPGISIKDSFYVFIYKPTLKYFSISPDSAIMAVGDSVQFTVLGSDQYGKDIETTPIWNTTIGEISSNGFFKCSTGGRAEITATDSESGFEAKTVVVVTDEAAQLVEIKITPDSAVIDYGETLFLQVKGYNQFGLPHSAQIKWSCDYGLIDSYGLYTADTDGITSIITAEDTLMGVIGTATIFVNKIVGVDKKTLPREFSISQNYPNPFNPSTTIEFGLPATSRVKVNVYNILGEKIAQLVNEIKPAGYYSINWNAGKLASGVYFYTINVKATEGKGEFYKVMKMLMVK